MKTLEELKKDGLKILRSKETKLNKEASLLKFIDSVYNNGATLERNFPIGGYEKKGEYTLGKAPKKELPIVDVITPVFNADWILQKTLNALLDQTYVNWRLWVVNDGSIDKSLDMIWAFAQNAGLDRVKIFDGPNQGVSSARNYARQMLFSGVATPGDYVAFMDADDVWDPKHLEESVKHLQGTPRLKIDFMYSDVDCVFPDGSQAFPYGIAYHEVLDITKLPVENPIYTSTVVCKMDVLKEVGEFDGRINGREDHDYWCRVAKAGFKMSHLRKTLTTYTVNPGGVAGTWNEEKAKIFKQKREDEE